MAAEAASKGGDMIAEDQQEKKENFFENVSGMNVWELDYITKQQMLEKIVTELATLGIEYGPAAARAAELRSNMQVLQNMKSALQSALRAERADSI